MKKKLVLFFMAISLVFVSGIAIGAGAKVKIFVDGKEVKTEAKVENGTTYVPLRAISEMLGAEVKWEGSTSSVIITSNPSTATPQTNTNLKQTINNVTIEVTDVIQDSDSLRLYVKYINNSSKEVSTGDSLTKIIHNGKQYKYDFDFNFSRYYDTGIKKAASYIEPTVSEESVIFFEPIKGLTNESLINLVLKASFEDYKFNNVKVTIK